LVQPTVNVLKH